MQIIELFRARCSISPCNLRSKSDLEHRDLPCGVLAHLADRLVLDDLPPSLPPLLAAYRLQERAASVGFDWPDTAGPLQKVREEADEVAGELATGRAEPLADEIGELLFAVVNLARKAGVEPGAALERANRKFVGRFRRIERLAGERGLAMESAGLAALDELWDEVKRDGSAR